MPKVSVLMPVYKTNKKYLQEAIESILNQTFTDFEFLILDDCPEDSRADIVNSFKDKRIKYSINETNLGISQSRNKLLDMAKGEYVAIFDHDDISLPCRLEKEVAYLDSHPEIGVISGFAEHLPMHKIYIHPENNIDIKTGLMSGCVVLHTAAMIRKSVLDASGIRYEEAYTPSEDYMLFLRLVGHTMFYNIQEVLVQYRNIEENTSHKQKNKMTDAGTRCKCFASREYPHLYSQANFMWGRRRLSISLFNFIPVLKLKSFAKGVKVYLFGLPLLTIKGDR